MLGRVLPCTQLVRCFFEKNVKNIKSYSVYFSPSSLFENSIILSIYSSNFHAVKRESDGAPGDFASLENERQIYKSVLEGGDIPLQGLSGLKRPSSSASTKGNWVNLGVLLAHPHPSSGCWRQGWGAGNLQLLG